MKNISSRTRKELIEALRRRYRDASKRDKTRMLNEFTSIVGCHRKYAIRLLGLQREGHPHKQGVSRRIYNEAVREALIVIWEAADRICGKRLKAILPKFVDSMEHHGHIKLAPEVRRRLLLASAATLDRLLSPVRKQARPRKKKRGSQKEVSKQIRVRTWRTRKDPFESVWAELLLELQETPDITAKELLERLQAQYPNSFSSGQLRTLQRREGMASDCGKRTYLRRIG